MSFMSFDYAMRAADAALQFQQNQGQNIKDVNQRSREVGTGNAKRKDDLVRQTIEAEYKSRSADIKKEKAGALMVLAKERMEGATLAAGLVGAGTLLGGMANGVMDLIKGDGTQMPERDQVTIDDVKVGENAVSFRMATGTGNTESGAMVAYNADHQNFSLVGVNTTSGKVSGFVNLSATEMAGHILNATNNTTGEDANKINSTAKSVVPETTNENAELTEAQKAAIIAGTIDNIPAGTADNVSGEGTTTNSVATTTPAQAPGMINELRGMIDQGPPAMFKEGLIDKDGNLDPRLQAALFNPTNGFFAQGSTGVGTESGEKMVHDLLANPATISSSYRATGQGVMRMLENSEIQKGLGIDDKVADKSRDILKSEGALVSGWDKFGNGANKVLFKPLGTALPQFMEMAKVMKEYEDEYKEKLAEYEAAKKDAANARKQLQRLESLLAAGSAG